MNNVAGNKLVYIPVAELYPHPDNPRKELGDLTELSDSIKAKGIMQNLTVVPNSESGYTVIIGHRRLEAAKLAGVNEVPCVIVEMSEREQLATMLLENMQRADLTVYEQAHGMQMMLNLGESVESISEKTGFSPSTVRRRVKLMDLNQKTLESVSDRQFSFEDLDKLNKIDDIDERNKVLEVIGTNNFENRYLIAINSQERIAKEKNYKQVCEERGFTKLDKINYNTHQNVKLIFSPSELNKLDELEEGKEYFYMIQYGTLYIYEKRETTYDEHQAKIQRENELRKEKLIPLKEATERAYNLRQEFIENLPKTEIKKHIKEIITFATFFIFREDMFGLDEDEYFKVLNTDEENVETAISENPEFAFFHAVCGCFPTTGGYFDNYSGKYSKNENLDEVYEFLKSLGYQMSDEEIELQNGTSKLFLKG